MTLQVVVMFGGGGSLGAFGCGVWKALAERLPPSAVIIGAAGASIGVVNAAFVVKHADDLRASTEAMERTWRQDMATPALPFAGWLPDRNLQSFNAVLTGLLIGTQGLARTNYASWNPVAGMNRLGQPLMDRSRMWQLLASHLGEIRTEGDGPVLGAPAVDVLAGKIRLFNSLDETVTVEHLAASSAIPFLFEAVTIDDRVYWDGDMIRQAALPLFLQRLRDAGRLPAQGSSGVRTLLVTIDQMSEQLSRLPNSGLEVAYRAINLLLHGKMTLAAEDLAGIDHVLEIRRQPMDHDAIAGQLDYSPQRVEELMEQGYAQAEGAWDTVAQSFL